MSRMLMLELLNGFRLALGLCLLFVLGRYLFRQWQIGPGWLARPAVPFALALLVNFAGDTGLRLVSWAWAWSLNRGRGSPFTELEGVALFLGSGLIATAGVALVIWITSPMKCRHWGWICSIGVGAAFVLAAHYWGWWR